MIKFRTTVAAFVIGTLAVAGTALGQVEENAKAALVRSAEAIKNLKDISASSRKFASGPFIGGMIDSSGEFKLIRGADKNHSPSLFKGKAKSVGNAGNDTFHFFLDVEGTTQTVTWVNDQAQTVYTRPLVVRTEQYNQLTQGHELLIGELFEAEPFRKELGASKITMANEEAVGGENCTVVRADLNDQTWNVWHISTTDYLPRRVETVVKLADQEQPIRIVVELTNVKANQNLTRKDLALATPDGYKVDTQLPTQATAPGAEPVVVPPRPELGPDRASGAPAFELRTAAGDAVTLESLRGSVVVLGFSDPRNGMSVRSLPVMETVHQAFSGKPVKVFAAACRDKSNEGVTKAMTEKNATFGVLLGADDVAAAYKVRGFPSFAVIDSEGKVTEFVQGMRTEEDLRERLTNAVNAALGEAGGN